MFSFIKKFFVEQIFEATLIGACRKGDIESARQYLLNGADANENDGQPLQNAAGLGHKALVELLISKGADVNEIYCDAPLHLASVKNHKVIVEILISKGANVNAKNHLGQTPLHYAAREGHNEVIELLIDNGADINLPTDEARIPSRDVDHFQNKETPLDWAIEQKQTAIADLLRKHGGKTEEELK
ncbi:ankyrin repeat domain-containing protein [Verrucomicrobia bacterium]|nr:ankyrin repeat domain-containing protein [Verrucomicrobiota bacterium]